MTRGRSRVLSLSCMMTAGLLHLSACEVRPTILQDVGMVEVEAKPSSHFASADVVPSSSAGCDWSCETPDGPCSRTLPCCPVGQWFDAAPEAWAESPEATDEFSCVEIDTPDSLVPVYYANCAFDLDASPPLYCGIKKQGASICVQNTHGHAYWTSTCQSASDCPAEMSCVLHGGEAELPADSPFFGQCERKCADDADCLRCDLACGDDATCQPKESK